jgi:succinyl-CoA synthetase beta subunit
MKMKVQQILEKSSSGLAENEVKDLLTQYGIKTTTYYLVKEKKDVSLLKLSYPVAFKVCSSKILHKTDVDGVKLNINTMDELLTIFDEFKLRFPKEYFLVDEMVEKGVEAIVGLVQDPTFGLCIMCGVGGIFTELYQDVSFRVVPIEYIDTIEMIDELKGKELFEGFRNMKVDRKSFSNLLMKVSKIGEELIEVVDQMDLNPVFLYENDYCVVDAKVILKKGESS